MSVPRHTAVQTITVMTDEADLRLDRWFKRHFPQIPHGRLEKLLRSGQVRVDGKRAEAALRLVAGVAIRVPPLDLAAEPQAALRDLPERDVTALRRLVIHRDDAVIVLDKPAGLAVQGGPGVRTHIDGLLEALRFDGDERPRLVHRLDRDTSGVLVLARTRTAAAFLARAFESRAARKTYWAILCGVPQPRSGTVDLALAKTGGAGRERMAADAEDGRPARTLYRVLDAAWPKACFVELQPLSGRTHQLRVHCQALGTPILGDGKYGGAAAFLASTPLARQVHLHARRIELAHPSGGRLDVTAPPPPHLVQALSYFGFAE